MMSPGWGRDCSIAMGFSLKSKFQFGNSVESVTSLIEPLSVLENFIIYFPCFSRIIKWVPPIFIWSIIAWSYYAYIFEFVLTSKCFESSERLKMLK